MKQSIQNQIKEIILTFLEDGTPKKVEEIQQEVQKHGIKIENGSSALRTALYNLKNENSNVTNPAKGLYQLIKHNSLQTSMDSLDGFEVIPSCTKKGLYLVVSFFADGTIALNSKLLNFFPDKSAEIWLKTDCTEMLLLTNGTEKTFFGKNGRTKNYIVLDRLKNNKMKFPVYYVGDWDASSATWRGKISKNNPNVVKKHLNPEKRKEE